jgi:hypothetical protein
MVRTLEVTVNPKDPSPEQAPTEESVDKFAEEAAERGRQAVQAIRDLVASQDRDRALVWAKARREGVDPEDVVLTRADYYSDD